MTEPFPPPDFGADPPPPPQGQPGYGYQQQGYGYGYGPVATYAGFWRRAGALLLDELVIGVVGSLLARLSDSSTIGLVNLVLSVAYFSIFEGSRGQTLGGMVANVRVVDADTGALIGIPRAIWRNLVRIVSGFVLALGYLWMLWDPRKQTWHDKAANSVVVRVA